MLNSPSLISLGCSQGPDRCRGDGDHHDAGVETPPGQTGLLQTDLRVSWWPQGWRRGPGQLRLSHPEEPHTRHAVHHQHHCREGPQEQCTHHHLGTHRSALQKKHTLPTQRGCSWLNGSALFDIRGCLKCLGGNRGSCFGSHVWMFIVIMLAFTPTWKHWHFRLYSVLLPR